ncbi:MAG: helix-turn-helix domain-containing protein, partial [Bacteroidales bacterium]|nr:helix-turn-helix domain-containing protein [Bacteroidales bacterium]
PVVRPEDEEILRPYYSTYYFFGSLAWQKTSYVCIELNHIFRQTDNEYVNILNAIRSGVADQSTLNRLNTRYIPNYQPDKDDDVVTLVTTNAQAERINSLHLLELDTEKQTFSAEISGDFPESSYPVERNLTLKVGSVVMFLKNDSGDERKFFNGKIGRITGFDNDGVKVKCNGNDEDIFVKPMRWENNKYTLDPVTKEIKEENVGTFTQIPLKTAWAVTIHKSQGLTFDRMLLNARNSFAHGQVYVALSRCRTLEGLVLLQPLSAADVISDPTIQSFAQDVENNIPTDSELANDRRTYFFNLVAELFDFSKIHAAVQTLQRAVGEAGTSFIGDKALFEGLDSKIYAQMMTVAEKFNAVINQKYGEMENPEEYEPLLERITKGCEFYHQKIDDFIKPLASDFAFNCDDKAKSTRIQEAFDNFKQLFVIKNGCINKMTEAFSIKSYLETKAKLSLDATSPLKNTVSSTSAKVKTNSKNPELYKLLTDWRTKTANETGMEPGEIVSYRTLLAISDAVPSEYKELIKVKGMGGSKGKAYGKMIFQIVYQYRIDKGMPTDEDTLQRSLFDAMSSEEKTFSLFNQGNTPEKIASSRGLALSTIYGHLVKYVTDGQIPPEKVIGKEVYVEIGKFLDDNPKLRGLTEIRNGLSDRFSYDQIRIALAGFKNEV